MSMFVRVPLPALVRVTGPSWGDCPSVRRRPPPAKKEAAPEQPMPHGPTTLTSWDPVPPPLDTTGVHVERGEVCGTVEGTRLGGGGGHKEEWGRLRHVKIRGMRVTARVVRLQCHRTTDVLSGRHAQESGRRVVPVH